MWFWKYEIEYYIVTFDEKPTSEKKRTYGIITGSNMCEAVKNLESYYGEDSINNILTLQAIDETAIDIGFMEGKEYSDFVNFINRRNNI